MRHGLGRSDVLLAAAGILILLSFHVAVVMHRVEIDSQGLSVLVRDDGYTGNASCGLSNLLNGSALVVILTIVLSYVAGAIRSDPHR